MRFRRVGSIGGVLVALLLLIFSCDSQEHKSESSHPASIAEISVRIGHIEALSMLPLYAAMDEGLLTNAGFEVTTTEFRTSDLAFKALEQGEVDVVAAGMSQAFELSDTHPGTLNVVGVLYSSTCLVGSTGPDAPKEIKDLTGKIAVFPGSVFQRYAREVLVAEGLAAESLKIEPMPPPLQIEALRKHEVQALFTLEPTGAMAVHEGVGTYLTQEDLLAKHFLNSAKFPGGCVAVSTKFAAEHADAEKRLIESFRQAMKKIEQPAFDMGGYLRKHTKIRADIVPSLRYEGAAFGDRIDREALKLLAKHLQEWKLLSPGFRLDDVLPDSGPAE